jgi:hypothetical protein
MIGRREFIGLLGGAAVAWPLAARAQQPVGLARIGFITLSAGPTPNTEGFQQGLQQLGYVEGQNLVLILSMGRRENRAARRFRARAHSAESRCLCHPEHRSHHCGSQHQ